MVHWNLIVYGIVTGIITIWFIVDLMRVERSTYGFPGKSKWEIGFISILIIAIEVIFTLIWGGIFWW